MYRDTDRESHRGTDRYRDDRERLAEPGSYREIHREREKDRERDV